MTNRKVFSFALTILVIFGVLKLIWWAWPSVFQTWEDQAGDQFIRLAYQMNVEHPSSPDIVHVDIDDESLSRLPYSKQDPRLYAELMRIFRESGVKRVLIDILFPVCREKTACEQLESEVQRLGGVYFPVVLSNDDLPEFVISNYDALNAAAAGVGHINISPGDDGVYRRLPLFITTKDGDMPAIGLRLMASDMNVDLASVQINQRSVVLPEAMFPDGTKKDLVIPTDSLGRNRINTFAPWPEAFAHYSVMTILEYGAKPQGLDVLMDELEDTYIVLSDVSTSGRDLGPTPFSAYTPLSSLHAHFLNSMLENHFLRELGPGLTLLIDCALIVILIVVAMLFRGLFFSLTAVGVLIGFIAIGMGLFHSERVLIDVVRPSLSVFLSAVTIVLIQLLQEQREKLFIHATVSNYFAPSVIDKILTNPASLDQVNRKELTVLFSDIVGFSSWSSDKDAAEIHQTLNQYFEEMVKIVFTHDGTVDKYIGDGLMVFFGDPIDDPDHTLKAVRAAIAMQQRVRVLKAEWEAQGRMPIQIRIGIHCGEVVVGNMGSETRMEYTVIGSNVNLAQRLESHCPVGGVLISQAVFNCVSDVIHAHPAGTIQAKGFTEPVAVFELVD